MAIIGGITVVAYLAAIALTPAHPPNSGSTGARIIRYATVHRGQLLASELLFALALAVLTVFAAGLYRIIRRAEGPDGWLAIASLASVAAGAGIFGAGTALFMVVAYRPATDPAVARAFWDAGWLAYNSAGFAFVAWIVIIVVAALRHRALPRWTAWIGVPVALINLAGPFAVQRRNRPVLPAGLVRPGRRPDLRRVATGHLPGGLATGPPCGRDPGCRHPRWCACRADRRAHAALGAGRPAPGRPAPCDVHAAGRMMQRNPRWQVEVSIGWGIRAAGR